MSLLSFRPPLPLALAALLLAGGGAAAAELQYREYPSSQDPNLKLYANFVVPGRPRPILVLMHGWHGRAKGEHADILGWRNADDWFVIEPDMRGRGDSTGRPDANGWELQDVVDAVEFAKKNYAGAIATPECVRLWGGSGGGGNTLALLGKFPDYFCAAASEFGISDYGRWFDEDATGEFRDEMEGQGWIGGTPESNREAYASRGGLTTVRNLRTPLVLVHGTGDQACPVVQTRSYVDRARAIGKSGLVDYLEFEGVGGRGHLDFMTPQQTARRQAFVDAHLAAPREPARIPPRGRMVVAGYLKTREFEVVLDGIDHVGEIEYDLEAGRFEIRAFTARHAVFRRRTDKGWTEQSVDIVDSPHPPE
jgi:pimeloyl-ACP methyl ester carboxylesterase